MTGRKINLTLGYLKVLPGDRYQKILSPVAFKVTTRNKSGLPRQKESSHGKNPGTDILAPCSCVSRGCGANPFTVLQTRRESKSPAVSFCNNLWLPGWVQEKHIRIGLAGVDNGLFQCIQRNRDHFRLPGFIDQEMAIIR